MGRRGHERQPRPVPRFSEDAGHHIASAGLTAQRPQPETGHVMPTLTDGVLDSRFRHQRVKLCRHAI